MFSGCVVISDLYLFQKIVLLNPCFIFSKNLMLSFIDKVTTGTEGLALFVLNFVLFVFVASLAWTGGLAFGLEATAVVLYISDMIHSFDYDKSSSISQLIKDKLKNLQKFIKYFNGTTTSVSNVLLSFGVLSLLFLSCTQKIYLLLSCCYLFYNYQYHYFHSHHYLFHLYYNFTKFLMS